MKLVIGLGNPGSQYANTRHNYGFMVVDALASALGASWKNDSKFKAEVAPAELEGHKIVLAKPQTFMNLSGEAVQRLMQFYKVAPADVWVLSDDLDTPFGQARLRMGGGSGGHNGLKSITAHIGEEYMRLRLGIGQNDRARESSEQYVLHSFEETERTSLPEQIETAYHILMKQLTAPRPETTIYILHKQQTQL